MTPFFANTGQNPNTPLTLTKTIDEPFTVEAVEEFLL